MPASTLAIDFGTSNSAAAILEGGAVRRLAIEAGQETLPTAVFFPANRGPMQIGGAASQALISGEEGRYMRALKSVLGTELLHERRLIGGSSRTLAQIVTAFLAEVKRRAEAATGQTFTKALSGRPVHFHSLDPDRDARAEEDLRGCYLAAGFDEVTFMFEPEAAALASHALGTVGEIGLIVDIGGGTSDFSVFRSDGGTPEILASHGIRLGGTNFDHAVSMTHVMPLLGYGGQLRREMGAGLLPVPNAIFVDLATWEKIPFVYGPKTQRAVAAMAALAVDRRAFVRLGAVLESELGHELAFAAERGKIAANAKGAVSRVEMGIVERGLGAEITDLSLASALRGLGGRISTAAQETLVQAEVSPDQVATVILVGGSSLMAMVSDEMRALCPAAKIAVSEAFTAVVDGLAMAAARPRPA